jgi:BlaI family penicillinase repressor
MPEPPRISTAEWDVMRVVWERHPITARQVVEALAGIRDWSDRTVKALLARLVKKGALGFRETGPRYEYHPLLSRDECVSAESRDFLERVHDGEVSPLLRHFLAESKLSADDIADLRRMLDERDDTP